MYIEVKVYICKLGYFNFFYFSPVYVYVCDVCDLLFV